LLGGLRVGSEVIRLIQFDRPAGLAAAGLASGAPPAGLAANSGHWEQELRNDRGQRVSQESATCDLDLSRQSDFRMAKGVAARCDACGKILSIGSDWNHASASQEDLCSRHLSELPRAKRSVFRCITSEAALGANQHKYLLKVRVPADVFPRGTPEVEGTVLLEVSHLINNKGVEETLASLVRPLMPHVKIEEYDGPRSFCRISVEMKDEAAVREVIKSLGRQRNKRASIKEISRVFNSPRF